MTRTDDEQLADIVEACAEIAEFVSRGRETFDSDRAVMLAVERLLEIIGEAANALDEPSRARFPAVPWHDITRLRVVLAHHYHRVDSDQVWAIAAEDVPRLATEVSSGS